MCCLLQLFFLDVAPLLSAFAAGKGYGRDADTAKPHDEYAGLLPKPLKLLHFQHLQIAWHGCWDAQVVLYNAAQHCHLPLLPVHQ